MWGIKCRVFNSVDQLGAGQGGGAKMNFPTLTSIIMWVSNVGFSIVEIPNLDEF